MRGRVVRNSLIFFLSEGLSSLLMVVTGVLLARLMNVADFGKFMSALAFATLLAVGVDSGMGMLAAKGIARKGSPEALNALFTWRLAVLVAASAVTPLVASMIFPSADIRRLAIGLTPGVLLVGMSDFFCWILKGAQRPGWCAGLQITSRLLLLGLSVWAVLGQSPLTSLAVSYAVAGAGVMGIGYGILVLSGFRLRWTRLGGDFFRATLPSIYKLGLIMILSVAFTRVDLMIVAAKLGDAAAGLFGAAGRVLDAIRLIPMVVYSVYLPLFSASHDDPAQLRARFTAAHDRLLILSILIALAGSLLAGPLFARLLGPSYGASAECFRPLVWSCVPMFSNMLMFSLLYALNDHRTPLIGISSALVAEILLIQLWLPRYGVVSASWARLFAELLNGSVMVWGLAQKLSFPRAVSGNPASTTLDPRFRGDDISL